MVTNAFGGGVGGAGGLADAGSAETGAGWERWTIRPWAFVPALIRPDVVLQLLLDAEWTLYSQEGEQDMRGRKEEGKGGGVEDDSGIDFLTILALKQRWRRYWGIVKEQVGLVLYKVEWRDGKKKTTGSSDPASKYDIWMLLKRPFGNGSNRGRWILENVKILKSNSAEQLENVPSLLGLHTDAYPNDLAHNEFNVVGLRGTYFPSPRWQLRLMQSHCPTCKGSAQKLRCNKHWRSLGDIDRPNLL